MCEQKKNEKKTIEWMNFEDSLKSTTGGGYLGKNRCWVCADDKGLDYKNQKIVSLKFGKLRVLGKIFNFEKKNCKKVSLRVGNFSIIKENFLKKSL